LELGGRSLGCKQERGRPARAGKMPAVRRWSAEVAAGDDEAVRIVAGQALAQRKRRFPRRRGVVACALAQRVGPRGPVLQILGDDMDDALLALQLAAAVEQRRAERGAAKALEDRRPDDQVGDPGFVFEGDKDDSVGASRALADEDEPGDLKAAIDRQRRE